MGIIIFVKKYMAIKLSLSKTEECLFCKSKWWGNPDIPEGFSFDDSLMFLCQIRCEDLVSLDKENRLPHKGMLYFFCDIPYYLGFYDDFEPPHGRLWDSDYVRVYYVEDVVEKAFRQIIFDDDFLPMIQERKIEFVQTNEEDYGHKLLGSPCQFEYEDWDEPCQGWINLLQIDSDEDDDYNLMFMDMGVLYVIINPDDLKVKDFSKVKAYLYST